LGYSEAGAVKLVLQIPADSETFDEEISGCIVSADSLIDSLLKQKALSVPSPVPQNISDTSACFAAWLFRRRRDPVGAEAFWQEANRFLDVYCESEGEAAFKVCQA
jgi:hypothetical protein